VAGKIMFQETNSIIENYLYKKYDNFSSEILTSPTNENGILNDTNKIKFCTIFDQLIFVLLYDQCQYSNAHMKLKELIYCKLQNLADIEIDFLFIKCLENLSGDYQYQHDTVIDGKGRGIKIYYITKQFIKVINDKVLKYLTNDSDITLSFYLEEIKRDIKFFLYTGQMEDIEDNYDYWQKFCYQLNFDDLYKVNIILCNIENYLFKDLKVKPLKDIILLYIRTDRFISNEKAILFSIPSREEMINSIVPKLLEEIKYIGTGQKQQSLELNNF
jgi:hypothetical protein